MIGEVDQSSQPADRQPQKLAQFIETGKDGQPMLLQQIDTRIRQQIEKLLTSACAGISGINVRKRIDLSSTPLDAPLSHHFG